MTPAKRSLVALLALAILLVGCTDEGDTSVEWGYGSDNGPNAWAGLADEFSTCGDGQQQSPVDIETADAVDGDGAHPVPGWQATDVMVTNNGHSVQADVPSGLTTDFGGRTSALQQFHWHRPSEHSVDGELFAMEMHFVHADDDGALTVLAVLVEEGAENPAWSGLWSNTPAPGDTSQVSDVDVEALLPNDLSAWTYPGSLTTPPCTEGVSWYVLMTPVQLSAQQIASFPHGGNNRPTQPLNGRVVTASR